MNTKHTSPRWTLPNLEQWTHKSFWFPWCSVTKRHSRYLLLWAFMLTPPWQSGAQIAEPVWCTVYYPLRRKRRRVSVTDLEPSGCGGVERHCRHTTSDWKPFHRLLIATKYISWGSSRSKQAQELFWRIWMQGTQSTQRNKGLVNLIQLHWLNWLGSLVRSLKFSCFVYWWQSK